MVFLNFWLVIIPVETFLARGSRGNQCFGSWWLVVARGRSWWLMVACGGSWWLVVACGGSCVVSDSIYCRLHESIH